jgi:hypothetical protein
VHQSLPLMFTSLLGHLKAGRGIAARPRPHAMRKPAGAA